jgi:two-component system, LytTR family, response regulator LytT
MRVLVVDDEQLAREELCFLLGEADVEVVGQAADGVEALRLSGELKPDVVFLDVQMPGLTGFEVARRLIQTEAPPQFVFVTAFDQHAIDAFGVNAVDYVLKPVDAARLAQSIERVRARLAVHTASRLPLSPDDLERVIAAVQARQDQRREHLAIRVGERFILVQSEEIVLASLVDDAIVVATPTMYGHSSFRTLDELQTRLDPAVFWRVHRSHLVNITKIKEVVPWFSRNYMLRMKDQKTTEIPVSRAQTKRLREYLQL